MKERDQNLIQFASLINLAFVDDQFDKQEYELLEKLASKLGITEEDRQMVLDNPDVFAIKPIDSFDKRLDFILDFFKIIYADHKLEESEYHLVRQYIQALGFKLVNTKIILNKSVTLFEENNQAFETLTFSEYKKYLFEEEN